MKDWLNCLWRRILGYRYYAPRPTQGKFQYPKYIWVELDTILLTVCAQQILNCQAFHQTYSI